MEPISVRVDYWTLPDRSESGKEPEGIEQFRNELRSQYASLVRGRSGACGGGLYDLAVQVVSEISLRDVMGVIAGGVAYDLVKAGTQSFFVRPIFEALRRLKSKNRERNVDLDELTLSFRDTDIFIKRVDSHSIHDILEDVFKLMAENMETLTRGGREIPYAIHIPIVEDSDNETTRFRSLLDVDETIRDINQSTYFGYWGVRYNLAGSIKIFDVKRKFIIDETYMTQAEYWSAKHREWDIKRALEKAAESKSDKKIETE